MLAKPVRLQLSGRKGFDLQQISRATNGLMAVVVSRPSKWGSPFRLTKESAREHVIARYRQYLRAHPEFVRAARKELRGKNLACWCKPGVPCHADVLLRVAAGGAP